LAALWALRELFYSYNDLCGGSEELWNVSLRVSRGIGGIVRVRVRGMSNVPLAAGIRRRSHRPYSSV